ncbi:3-carboxy-cis,cis-muconate cycloisomerase, partial [Streptomyces sp. SID5926]|nr:3-carboxy-cis,cis-muconate cycloisomerase [Streptomyces sp. SID5926]
MTSPAVSDPAGSEPGADTGLLAPGWTGSPTASATGDRAYLRALLDAEAALT